MPSRRTVLCGIAAAVAASGCVSRPAKQADGNTTTRASGGTTTRTTSSPDGPRRGAADPITIERTVTADEYQYVPSNDTVRYPAARVAGDVVEYDYADFEFWATVEGASAAAAAIDSRLDKRFSDADSLDVLVSGRDGRERGRVLEVALTTHLTRDGEILYQPSVSLSVVVDAVPLTVTVTIHFAGHTHTAHYPVYVTKRTIQNA